MIKKTLLACVALCAASYHLVAMADRGAEGDRELAIFRENPKLYVLEKAPVVNSLKATARNCKISLELRPNVEHKECIRFFKMIETDSLPIVFMLSSVGRTDEANQLNLGYQERRILDDASTTVIDIETIILLVN